MTQDESYVPPAAPALAEDAHKGTAGRLLCIAGCAEMPGAAILVVRAAHRAGAGRVTLTCLDGEMLAVIPAASPETVLLDLSSAELALGEGDLPGVPASPAFHARVVGPGLGDTARTASVLALTLEASRAGVPQVFDADALNALGSSPETLASASGPTVVTPHAGEAARLLGRDVPPAAEGRVRAARELAERTGGLAVLKGRGSVVTDGERVYVNATGNPGMATAGSGDVLSGILGAYLAATGPGFDVFDAVAAAVRVHGVAGDLAAAELGERAVVASDLVAFLPAAQRAVASRDG